MTSIELYITIFLLHFTPDGIVYSYSICKVRKSVDIIIAFVQDVKEEQETGHHICQTNQSI
jgi:hypothetical protein